MTELWNSLIVGPLEGLLTGLYGFLGSYGLAIIILTIAIKLVTFPLTYQQLRSSKSMREVQPLMEEAKRRYGKDKEKLSQETMRIYKENGVNPAMGCLPMVIQMPIWFGLYSALRNLADNSAGFNQGFLWMPSLAQPDHTYILVGLTIVTQFVVQKMMTMPSTDPQQQTMNKVMMFMPLTFGFVAINVPSGLALYWVTTNLFTFFQQLFTTGWGDLLPNRSKTPATPPARVKPADNVTQAEEASEAPSQTKAVRSARQKKQAGAKPPREEKRANGKR
ncbi:MAG: YidC/Oxa1 family membrane protein insertase [Bacteroidetes bacterium]|nr:YidC/Oxa1 family membrane protein insertase [Bacteroidota bacterium]